MPDASPSTPFSLDHFRDRSWLLLIFAPSTRSPAYEEFRRLQEEPGTSDLLHGVECVIAFHEGTSYAAGSPLDDASAEALRARFDVRPEQFLVVLIDPQGRERRRSDAPLKPSSLRETIEEGAQPGTGG